LRDSLDLGGKVEQFGCPPRHKAQKGMDHRQTLVAGRRRIGMFLLPVDEESTNRLVGELFDGKPRDVDGIMVGKEPEQQTNCIAVTLLSVATQADQR
jgi:hypothetical protein